MEILSKKKAIVFWTVAVLFSIVLNVFLFDIMSYMIQQRTMKCSFQDYVSMINVVRIKKREYLTKKRKNPPKKEEKNLKTLIKKTIYTSFKPKMKVNLLFEINPKLPPIPRSIVLPKFSLSKVDLPELKSVYGLSEIDHPLVPVVRIPPIYPLRAKRMGIEGWVKIRFVVDENGRVGRIKVLESHPKGVFEDATIRAVSRWRFKPGTVDGVPVKTMVETSIKFKLE